MGPRSLPKCRCKGTKEFAHTLWCPASRRNVRGIRTNTNRRQHVFSHWGEQVLPPRRIWRRFHAKATYYQSYKRRRSR